MVRYLNPRTGETFPLHPPLWRAPDGGPLLLTDIDPAPSALPAPGVAGVWRWRAALPPPRLPPDHARRRRDPPRRAPPR